MKIGIIGATGAVGRQMIQCLEEQQIPCDELRLFASSRSEGKKLKYHGEDITVHEINEAGFNGLDFVLGAVSDDLSRQWAPLIQKSGAVYIDNSKAFRLQDDVPLIVPEINGADVFHHHGIIANPNCSTIITLMAVAPIHQISPIRRMIASTYQAVSGAGLKGMKELSEETEEVMNKKNVSPSVFPAQIAFNCIPWIGGNAGRNDYTSEEKKMENEGRKILHDPDLKVTCTCVRVPVYRSHSISVSLQCEKEISIPEAEKAISSFPGDVYMTEGYPMPLMTSDQDEVFVGRLRRDEALEGGLALWCCGDQIRKGAAANAVQILACLIKR